MSEPKPTSPTDGVRPNPNIMRKTKQTDAVRRQPRPPRSGGDRPSRQAKGGSIGDEGRLPRNRALAPYGLVPLPDHPMPAERLQTSVGETLRQEELLRSHDRRIPGTHTGWIDLRIQNLTPLFIGATDPQNPESTRSLRVNGRPAIPGSSLRGMLRDYLRMLTGGEVGPVNTPQLFFRAPIKVKGGKDRPLNRSQWVMSRLHDQYKAKHSGNVETKIGFLFRGGDGWRIKRSPSKLPLEMSFTDFQRCIAEHEFPHRTFLIPPNDNTYGPMEDPHHRHFQFRIVYALDPPPDPDGGYQEVERVFPSRERASEFQRTRQGYQNHEIVRCVIVLTGVAAGQRTHLYLFPMPDGFRGDLLSVPERLITEFESSEQVTQYQQQNFPGYLRVRDIDAELNEEESKRRLLPYGRGGGLPAQGIEPVWFRADESGEVLSFGRAGGYRIAVGDFDPIRVAVPEPLMGETTGRAIDVPRALFGDIDLCTSDDDRPLAVRGRVSVGSAVSSDENPDDRTPLRVQLLSPHRTAFGQYLVQNHPSCWEENPRLNTWSQENQDRIRLTGYKTYLHRHATKPDGSDAPPELDVPPELKDARERWSATQPPGDTERDIVPLRAGLTFHARITFRNLTDAELGALLRVLHLGNPVGAEPGSKSAAKDLGPAYAHKIGLGKPLGLGSIHITLRLRLTDPRERTRSLDAAAGFRAVGSDEVQRYLDAFDGALLAWEREEAARAKRPEPVELRHVERVDALLLSAQWRDRLPASKTRTMTLEEFAHYPVLPSIRDRFSRKGASRGR
ncbi:TIGR03986 family type III CRISPR-associated RAMP protein [Marinitenerispora sediminis]|uniref:TIGR03986 family CRISPR-associated RAMP protein n=1 Tax=Marinitenerispora sediminis TaxID=1931232 RepID=A0A368T9R8_9ACTN|nr:TIGR03986 family CRISPR-associated RAMP protein [Marinitenerispora sediminis]RCV52452.1 TIGR03986 family CRISPR-associated RAMP protein [Marinitenerispora sediminis]RCV54967.1 TIGR03986 family CRISPR-associated RAMP protein [Marinitenerispora sediminis]RCV61420.1 TIGR03986 family CRISPR-associated RAMP protein [Marinitenerispora sediminis]